MRIRGTGVMRFKADGTPVDDDDDGVLKDGERVVVSPMIKDTSAVPAQDAVPVNDAHAEYVDRLTRRTTTQDAQSTTVDAQDDGIDAHAAYVGRLKRT